jgi:catalase
LTNDAATRDFIAFAFAHSKFIGYASSALPLLKATLGDKDPDEGFVEIKSKADIIQFVKTCRQLRFWEREMSRIKRPQK